MSSLSREAHDEIVISKPARPGLLRQFIQWRRARQSRYFVQCPCTTCGGMVSIRECMVQGKENWFCTEESRSEYEARVK